MKKEMAVLALAAALVTGCGATPTYVPPQGASGAVRTSTAAEAGKPATTAKCVAADVRGALGDSESGDGISSIDLTVTNTSTHPCTIDGYGGIGFYAGGDGRPVSITLTRKAAPAPALLTLKPGGSAVKGLNWTTPPPACTPTFIGELSFILPDDTKSTLLTHDVGLICDTVDGGAYH